MVVIVNQKVNCYDRDIVKVRAMGFINPFIQFHVVQKTYIWPMYNCAIDIQSVLQNAKRCECLNSFS